MRVKFEIEVDMEGLDADEREVRRALIMMAILDSAMEHGIGARVIETTESGEAK